MSAFLDTSALLAFLTPEERDHAEAASFLGLARGGKLGRILSSDFVYDETVTLALRRLGKRTAQEADAIFHEPRFVTMLRVSPEEFDEARSRFLQRLDSRLSLTDWTIVVQCERRRVGTIISFDKGFDGVYARNTVPARP